MSIRRNALRPLVASGPLELVDDSLVGLGDVDEQGRQSKLSWTSSHVIRTHQAK